MARAQSSRFSEVFDSVQLAETSTLAPSKPVPRVRIHFPPPYSLKCREIRLGLLWNLRGNGRNSRNYCSQTGLEKVYCSRPHAGFAAFFSGGHPRSEDRKIV